MIELVVLTPDDWGRWRELRLAALAEAPYAFGSTLADWQGDGDREERWRGRLSIPGSHNLLALWDGEPAGMASGVPGPRDGVVELISLWVAGKARGRGVGDRLIEAVVGWAERERAEVVELAVTPGNARAVALYRRHGFADTGQLGDVLPDGSRERVMARRLSPGPG
ncbi:GNAT family N-acetyltransferase [Streptomyces lydicus]|uniref:GNAT family N-acetyltransferase n=1 Tax=Streptomyces lydicus TaxID=47763 RepID=UPI00098227EB|nr:GNAT family N-acetyltransferase [Streptomyces lydicus]